VIPATLTLDSLRQAYADGLSPVDLLEEVHARIAARGDDHVWISVLPPAATRAAAAALDPADRERLPLWGMPYALKDNLDLAGTPTTAACPDFAYVADADAAVVERLTAAGAICVGKTNLDQFATGLNGTRSPYGAPAAVGDPALVSGGSSSGSAVAVASGEVPFAIGTDTAGSGRVPAALNGIVGVKPSIGLASTRGTVPACRSLDCPSVFAHDVADAAAVLAVIAGYDAGDPWSRELPRPPAVVRPAALAGARLAVPAEIGRWGARGEREAWHDLLASLRAAGAELVPTDMTDFLTAGAQLYQGAWLAERLDGLEDLLVKQPDSVLPEIRAVLEGAGSIRGVEVFAALSGMRALRQRALAVLASVDALLTPTVTETFTIEEVRADPVALNSRLGTWTTFTNLLDLCAVSVPAGGTPAAPFGVTVQAVAGRDADVAALAAAVGSAAAGTGAAGTGAAGTGAAGTGAAGTGAAGSLELAVVGAHLEGQPLHPDLLSRGAVLVERTSTAPAYRLFALRGTTPPKPGLRRVASGGAPIEVEVYRLPLAQVGGFLATVAAPLAIGEVVLTDGRAVHGFVCEPAGLEGAEDITDHGGWRAYLGRSSGLSRRAGRVGV
jgi:allophanate hydrolase